MVGNIIGRDGYNEGENKEKIKEERDTQELDAWRTRKERKKWWKNDVRYGRKEGWERQSDVGV